MGEWTDTQKCNKADIIYMAAKSFVIYFLLLFLFLLFMSVKHFRGLFGSCYIDKVSDSLLDESCSGARAGC